MNRADLHSAFTKIALWNQTQFSKIVYVDADIVAYRAPEELFDIDAPFSAAPDIGWPDIFNSGVMVLTPDETEYARLADLADRGVSFDGADQGLLNQHFGTNYNRISFTYNVTPSAHYQQPPPRDSRPEAEKFPDTRYEMSRDTTPFVPPVRYPSPPRDMWYQVPVDPPKPTEKPRAIFPWETNQPQPTRVFADPPPPPPLETGFGSSPPPRIGGSPWGQPRPCLKAGIA
ncbi:unnamed protein product [Parascedosporium putredinis]|uniref:Glycogenin n=1 Tax=Parascedosporium putredinis TaxID=1442378 RepID=A0A9P1M7X7_9PEZI|nr:unnamed protein product [Parascedosporium putredinis]CAI7991408.1 unnamed protein product [Parascedosporium putredinis]